MITILTKDNPPHRCLGKAWGPAGGVTWWTLQAVLLATGRPRGSTTAFPGAHSSPSLSFRTTLLTPTLPPNPSGVSSAALHLCCFLPPLRPSSAASALALASSPWTPALAPSPFGSSKTPFRTPVRMSQVEPTLSSLQNGVPLQPRPLLWGEPVFSGL